MKNSIQNYLSRNIMFITGIFFVIALFVQIILSYIFYNIKNFTITKGFIDLSAILWDKSGELTIYYTDSIRIISFVILFIPYMFAIMKTIKKMIVTPLKEITYRLEKIDYNKLSERLEVSTKYELTELKDTFNELLDRLETVSQEKAEMEKQKDLLITGMAHDLKTPITTIRGYSQALNEGVVLDEVQKTEYLTAINRKAIQLDHLISLLFDYAKLTTMQVELSYETLDLGELIKENIGLFYTEFEEKKINFKFDIADKVVMVWADRKQLNRVFANLYTNALKHNHSGDTVSTILNLKDGITIYIEDTGDDIPEHIKKHIFEPFITGDDSRKSGSGTGLGLSIASKIIELHNGSITLEHSKDSIFTKRFVIKL